MVSTWGRRLCSGQMPTTLLPAWMFQSKNMHVSQNRNVQVIPQAQHGANNQRARQNADHSQQDAWEITSSNHKQRTEQNHARSSTSKADKNIKPRAAKGGPQAIFEGGKRGYPTEGGSPTTSKGRSDNKLHHWSNRSNKYTNDKARTRKKQEPTRNQLGNLPQYGRNPSPQGHHQVVAPTDHGLRGK